MKFTVTVTPEMFDHLPEQTQVEVSRALPQKLRREAHRLDMAEAKLRQDRRDLNNWGYVYAGTESHDI